MVEQAGPAVVKVKQRQVKNPMLTVLLTIPFSVISSEIVLTRQSQSHPRFGSGLSYLGTVIF